MDARRRAWFTPGALTGRLDIGSYSCAPTANLNVRIGGRTAGELDVLAVMGGATLDGALNVTLVGGFTPSVDESFDIMTFSSRTGTFSLTNLPQLPAGRWEVQYGTGAVTLAIVAAGAPSAVTARSE